MRFFDQIEAVNKEHPIKNLRWVLAHINQINEAQLERMKKLGMYAAVHPWAVINGAIMHDGFGDGAFDMPPFRTLQDSGIVWGLGTDGTAANQTHPFVTCSPSPLRARWWAARKSTARRSAAKMR